MPAKEARIIPAMNTHVAVPTLPMYSVTFALDGEAPCPCGEQMMIRDGGSRLALRLNPRLFHSDTDASTTDSNDTVYVTFLVRVWNALEYLQGKVRLMADY